MNTKMRQQFIPFQSGHGQAGGFHAVKHLGENSKIIAGRAETADSANSPDTDNEEKQKAKRHGQPNACFICRFCLFAHRIGTVPSTKTVNKQYSKNQNTACKERPAEGV